MSGNQVRGPTSALSSFLRERGIRVPTNPYRRRQQQQPQQQVTEPQTTPEEELSINNEEASVNNSASESLIENQESSSIPPRSSRSSAKKRKQSTASSNKKKTKKKKSEDEFTESDAENDNGAFSTRHLAPRSMYSKRKKMKTNAGEPESMVRFCSRCLRRYIPERTEHLCIACLSIRSHRTGGIKRSKKLVSDDGTRVALLSLKDMCIRLVADLIDHVEQFGDIAESTKLSISKIISKHRQLNNRTLQLFLGPLEMRLDLYDCTLIDSDGYSMISYMCPNLKTLSLEMCGKITDSDLKLISESCHQLEEISLRGAFLCSEIGLSSLLSLKLKKVSIGYTEKLGERSLQSLLDSSRESLVSLDIEACPNLGSGMDVLRKFECLESLSLSSVGTIDEETLSILVEALGPKLTTLKLNDHPQICEKVMDAIAKNCTKLHNLSLSECPALTSEIVSKFLCAFQPKLESLSLKRNVSLDDSILVTIVNMHGSTLKSLDLNGLDELTNHSLIALATGAPHLEDVDVSWIRSVDDDFLEKLIASCPKLSKMKVYGCNRLTEILLRQDLKNAKGDLLLIQGNEFN